MYNMRKPNMNDYSDIDIYVTNLVKYCSQIENELKLLKIEKKNKSKQDKPGGIINIPV